MSMNAIVAVDQNFGIGYKGALLFHIPDDLKRFYTLTRGGVVIMGRETFKSLPNRAPLKDRINIVMSGCDSVHDGVITVNSAAQLKLELKKHPNRQVFVIGGEAIYLLLLPYCRYAYLTEIQDVQSADRFFPQISSWPAWTAEEKGPLLTHNGLSYRYVRYKNLAPEVL